MRISNICVGLTMALIYLFPYFLLAQDCQPDSKDRLEVQEIEGVHNFICKVIIHRKFGKKYNATASFVSNRGS